MSRFLAGDALRALRGRVRRRGGIPPPAPTPPPYPEPPAPAAPPYEEPAASEPPPLFGPPSASEPHLFGAPERTEPPPARVGPPAPRIRRGAVALRERAARAGGAVADAWMGVDIYVRRRLVMLVLLAGLVAAFFLLAVPALPCGFPGGSVCAPPDDAAKLVPGNALVYVHADTDRSSSQYRDASSVTARIPTISAQLLEPSARAIPGTGGIVGFARDVRPWIGDEATLALLPARGPPQQVNLLAIGDERGARRYRASLEGPGARSLPYRGVDVEHGRRGVATAIVNGFLAIGTAVGVRQVVDTATGAQGASSLASAAAADRVREQLPSNRVADAYLSPAGVAAVAGRTTGLLSSLAPFVAAGATEGAAVALVAGSDTLQLEIRSALNPARVKSRPGFFAAFAPFDDTLASRLPPGTLAYVGFGRPGESLTALLSQAGTEEPGLARGFSKLLRRTRREARIKVRRDLLPALGDEGALALEPAPSAALAPPAHEIPYVVYAGADVDAHRARTALARLRRPLARTLGRGGGGRKIVAGHAAGAATASLRISPLVDLTYAVAQGILVIATDPAGVGALLRPQDGGLAASDLFDRATSGLGGSHSLLAYLNVHGLITLGERAGLAANPGYAALAPELHRLDALGISVTSDPDELATSVRLLVGG